MGDGTEEVTVKVAVAAAENVGANIKNEVYILYCVGIDCVVRQ